MTETTAPTDYTELRKAAEAAQHDGDEDSCCVLGLMHDQIIALLDAHATVVAERDALREALKPMAIAANNFDSYPVKDATQWFAFGGSDSVEGRVGAISVADLRAARSALAATEPKE